VGPPPAPDVVGDVTALDELDLSLSLKKKEEAARLEAAAVRLAQLRLVLGGLTGGEAGIGPPLCVLFEGWDASGKGGVKDRGSSRDVITRIPHL